VTQAVPAPVRPQDYHPLELATGVPRGQVDDAPLEIQRRGPSPWEALEQVLLPALRRPPCLVSFSGGRDSSAVLAAAADVARRHGLPPPVPVSLRFAAAAHSHESPWQELVVRHLALPDWERVELRDELDVVGPYARAVLRRHGLLYPFNAHLTVPVIERGPGGSLLTGVGGDEVLLPARYRRVNAVLAGRAAPRPRDLTALASAYGPRPLRAAMLRSREPYDIPWLTPSAAAELQRWRSALVAREEVRWDHWLTRTWWTSRSRRLAEASIARLAADEDVVALAPLQAPAFLEALARTYGRAGFPSRTRAMRALFGHVLPEELVSRSGKAAFNQVFWGPYSRELADRWDGQGVDEAVVDGDALRRAWQDEHVDGRSKWLLQSVLLREWAMDGSGAEPA
jgi:hypothetical protein